MALHFLQDIEVVFGEELEVVEGGGDEAEDTETAPAHDQDFLGVYNDGLEEVFSAPCPEQGWSYLFLLLQELGY